MQRIISRRPAGILLFLLSFLFFYLDATVSGSRIAASEAELFVAELGSQGIKILQQPNQTIEQREAQFRAILENKFDLDFISRFALGRNWRLATEDQQEEYQQLFSEFILRTYSSRLSSYNGQSFSIESAVDAGQNDVIVRSIIAGASGPPLRADWRVRKAAEAALIIDVSVEGISMSINQREEFSSVVQREGIEGLLKILRARTLGLPAEGPS